MGNKHSVQVGGIWLGTGMPKVCVPVMGKDARAMAEMAARAEAADLIEVRIDSLSSMPTLDGVRAACSAVRQAAGERALLLTLRTERDGGAGSADATAYEALLMAAAEEKLCDALDVELSVGDAAFERIVRAAHTVGTVVVGSSHDFDGTPTEETIVRRLERMQMLGADVCKIAVMPKTRADVLRLMTACVRADEQLAAPVIAIAMGELGALTRLGGEAIGSVLTFGTAGQQSAPGQMDAAVLRGVLRVVHDALA